MKPAISSSIAKKRRSTRKVLLQRHDWVKAGLEQLATVGPDAVTITWLTDHLGVTKGSFYWHFESRDDLMSAMLEEWELHATERVIEKIETTVMTPKERVRSLAMLASGSSVDEFGGAIELAMRSWARTDKGVRAVVSSVDAKRIDYLERLFAKANPKGDEELMAALHYSLSVGLRLIYSYSETKKRELRETALTRFFLKE